MTFKTDILEIAIARRSDYDRLSHYHYCLDEIGPTTQIYKIRAKAPYTSSFPDPIGVAVYKAPIPDIRPRYGATKRFFKQPESRSDQLKLVNKNIEYLARIIIDPRFWKLGLASWLLKDTLERQTKPIIETLTPIDFTNKMFQKAGFKLYTTPAPTWYRRLVDCLYEAGLTQQSLTIPLIVNHRLRTLKPALREKTEKAITNFLYHFRHRRNMQPGMERTRYLLSKIPYPEAYLIWWNPRTHLTTEI